VSREFGSQWAHIQNERQLRGDTDKCCQKWIEQSGRGPSDGNPVNDQGAVEILDDGLLAVRTI
jgi:hypothetical protein